MGSTDPRNRNAAARRHGRGGGRAAALLLAGALGAAGLGGGAWACPGGPEPCAVAGGRYLALLPGAGGPAAPRGAGMGASGANASAGGPEAGPGTAPGAGRGAGAGAGPEAAPGVGLGAGAGARPGMAPGVGRDAGAGAGPEAAPGVGLGAGAGARPGMAPGVGRDAGAGAGPEAAPGVGLGAGADAGAGAGPEAAPGMGRNAGTGAPRGALLFLHGWGGRAEDVLAQDALVGPALARGYAVLAPQGMPRRPGDTGGSWNSALRPGGRDDVAFLQAVIADARARLGLGDAPVLAAGFSGGGMMVWRLACDAPGAADAFAPVAGLLWRPLPERCAGPVRLLHSHGWADAVVPLEGRSVGGGVLTQGDLFAGLALLRAANGCADDAPDAYDAPGPFLRRNWTECAPGAGLGLALFPGGHETPAGWTDMALDWFEAPAR